MDNQELHKVDINGNVYHAYTDIDTEPEKMNEDNKDNENKSSRLYLLSPQLLSQEEKKHFLVQVFQSTNDQICTILNSNKQQEEVEEDGKQQKQKANEVKCASKSNQNYYHHNQFRWNCSTKYYDASIIIEDISLLDDNDELEKEKSSINTKDNQNSNQNNNNNNNNNRSMIISGNTAVDIEIKPSAEAIVFLVPQQSKEGQPNVFFTSLAMMKYRDKAIEKDLDIRLVVYIMNNKEVKVNNDQERNRIKEIEQIKEWCLDHQFEFIQVPSSSPSLLSSSSSILEVSKAKDTAENSNDAHEGVEKEGYERVVEALQAHTWDSLILKDQRTVKEYEVQENRQEISRNVVSDMITNDQNLKTSSTTFSVDNKPINKDRKKIDSDILANAMNIHDEDDLDELDSLFHRVKEISISSREGRFRSDEERRREAASTALKLAAVFGLNMDDLGGIDMDSSDEEMLNNTMRKGERNGVQAE